MLCIIFTFHYITKKRHKLYTKDEKHDNYSDNNDQKFIYLDIKELINKTKVKKDMNHLYDRITKEENIDIIIDGNNHIVFIIKIEMGKRKKNLLILNASTKNDNNENDKTYAIKIYREKK